MAARRLARVRSNVPIIVGCVQNNRQVAKEERPQRRGGQPRWLNALHADQSDLPGGGYAGPGRGNQLRLALTATKSFAWHSSRSHCECTVDLTCPTEIDG